MTVKEALSLVVDKKMGPLDVVKITISGRKINVPAILIMAKFFPLADFIREFRHMHPCDIEYEAYATAPGIVKGRQRRCLMVEDVFTAINHPETVDRESKMKYLSAVDAEVDRMSPKLRVRYDARFEMFIL